MRDATPSTRRTGNARDSTEVGNDLLFSRPKTPTQSGVGIMQDYQWLINSGFAALVAWYVLTRLEPSIRQLERTVNLLAIIVAKSSGIDYDEVRREYQGYDQGR